ncbi:MAG: dihydrolipoamide acetyltransferase family protein [Fimbriimonadaceae bacterium]
MTEIIMPKMGDGMEEGTLLEWLKKEGDAVRTGEPIGTIQTDKATLELVAPENGVLGGLLLKGGETVPVGKPIGLVLSPGETVPESWAAGGGASAPAKSDEPPSNGAPVAEADEAEAAGAAPTATTATSGGARVKASPLAKRLAEELGIDIRTVAGSGPGGRVTEKDVRESAAKSKPTPAAPPVFSTAAPLPKVDIQAEDRVVQLNKIRQITAQRTTESKQLIPHFYVTVEVDVERLQALRQTFEEEGAGKVSVNDFILKACAVALRQMPSVNAVYQGDKVVQFGAVHIGMAVALEDGLTVPVLKHVQALTLRQISEMSRELAVKAREGRLSPDQLSGSTFSISNMGMLGVESFAAIINAPNAAILAVASARKKVVVNDEGELEVRQRMNLTGSFDHRVVDGAVGAKFMNVVKELLENPTRLLS